MKIASVTFRVPNPAIISASSLRATSSALDSTQGAFLEFPNGPYYGKWGIYLQSSAERRANGFPPPFDAAIAEGAVGAVLQVVIPQQMIAFKSRIFQTQIFESSA
ncbi:hypothetical protein [Duganella sp. P38]|uniref:hypothetical protein n=1 Tax=Duganella sp. P38 TaxID=3423949 RepID=UPI003D798C95